MTLRKFYRICVWYCLIVYGIMVAVVAGGAFRWWNTYDLVDGMPTVAFFPLGTLIVFGAVFATSVWLGMMFDCIFVSEQKTPSRIGWLLLMVLLNVIGALIYYFRRYDRREPGLLAENAPTSP